MALIADFRYAFRVLRNSPGFTAVAVLSLALGIGANTAIFTLLNAIVLRELPVPNPKELVIFGPGQWGGIMGGLPDETPQLFSVPFYREIRDSNGVFRQLAAIHSEPQRVYARFDAGVLEPFRVRLVSGNYFTTLEVPAQLGRTLSPNDDGAPGTGTVAVLSDSYWKQRFARDRSVVGRKFTAGDRVYTIVGVAAPGFFGTKVGESADMWLPMSMLHQVVPWIDDLNEPLGQSAQLIARLKPGVSAETAAGRMDAVYHQWMWQAADARTRNTDGPGFARAHVRLDSGARGSSSLRDDFALPLQILTAVVGIVLLIACANIANLLLARATARRREFAIRIAVGARRSRLVQQSLAESLLLALAGGAAGLLVAVWGSQALVALVSAGPDPLPLDTAPDLRVLSFTVAISLLTAVVFGLAPSLRATQTDPNTALKEGRGAAGASRAVLGKLLVAGQVALSLLLLVGAGLFGRTIQNLTSLDTGFNRANVLLLDLDTDYSGYSSKDPRLPAVYDRIEKRVLQVPGVQAAGMSQMSFGPANWSTAVKAVGSTESGKDSNGNVVSTGYFDAVGIPIKLGRAFQPSDSATAPRVTVVNEKFARDLFPGESPIGKKIDIMEDGLSEIVGVAQDAKYVRLRERPRRMFYLPVTQRVRYAGQLHVRVAGDAAALIPEIRRAVTEAEPNFPIHSILSMQEQVGRSVRRERMIATLSTFFSILALVLACVGLYGILSYNVSRRTGEIGIRMALGARAATMIRMILSETVLLVSAGLAVGIPAVLVSARFMKSLLYGVDAIDWLTIAGAVFILLAFAVAAAWLPARRAAKVDPMVALRYE